jgi:hypothetical protein
MTDSEIPALPAEWTTGASAPCLKCGAANPLDLQGLYTYFEGRSWSCRECKAEADLFETLCFAADFVFTTFSVVGARQTYFTIELSPGEVMKIDLSSRMDAPGARVLWVNYSPQSDGDSWVMPVELHGNSPTRRWLPQVTVLGRGFRDTRPDFRGKVGVSFAWIPQSEDDASWESLVDAFEAIYAGDLVDVVLPANIGVEVRLNRFLDDFIQTRTGIGRERVENFLKDGATYGHQLDVVLPLVVALTGVPAIPAPVAAGLSRLKKERNAIAHTGTPRNPVDKSAAVEMGVSAVLGCVYIDYLRKKLLSSSWSRKG